MPKTGIIISDLHCGHLFGLTPPDYQISPDDDRQLARQRSGSKKHGHGMSHRQRLSGTLTGSYLTGTLSMVSA